MIKDSREVAVISGQQSMTYPELKRRISLFARIAPSTPGERFIILSENRTAWGYALYPTWKNGAIAVPVDATSTAEDVAYILRDCRPACIWTSRQKEALALEAQRLAETDIPQLIVEPYEDMMLTDEEEARIESDEQDTALICYTSGTTGMPKGVMLSFQNIIMNVKAVSEGVPIYTPERRTMVLLPLHHVLPLMGSVVAPLMIGGGITICPTLSAPDIMKTMQEGRVAIMIGVPRLWQTLYRGIRKKIDEHAVTRALYKLCEKAQNRSLSRLIFRSVRQKMGGAIDYFVSGGAALDRETAVGLKTLGLDVLEGYGMTEAAPMICFTRPDDIIPGCVGKAVPEVELRLVNEELWARGHNIMQGYYNRPEETADVLDSEGWLHTGDLATIDEAGHVFITGRKKEIIVLSNGKNINPVEIEEKIEHYADIVKECAVVQDNDLLKVIIVPQEQWAQGRDDQQMEQEIKRDILQVYNRSVAPYKKLMSLMIYHGELPRTRMEKLQRFKLKGLLARHEAGIKDTPAEAQGMGLVEPDFEEYRIIKQFIQDEKKCEVRPTDSLETDLAFDSLDKVALQGFIEQSFGIKLTSEQIAAFDDLNAMASFVYEFKTHIDVERIDWHSLLANGETSVELPRMSPTGGLFIRLFRSVCSWYFPLRFKGEENIPDKGPFILTPNHQSYLDGALVVSPFSWPNLRDTFFYAKKAHVRTLTARFLARHHNIIIMDMDTLKDSIQMLASALKQGKSIVIFPEGTRTRDGQVGEFKKTFAILSRELNVPIVPVAISGAYEALPRGKSWPRRHPVTVKYLSPILPGDEDYDGLCRKIEEMVRKSLIDDTQR
jgi:long-chain acyl-CoA synthetase